MYIKTTDGFADGDLANLERLLAIIDSELSRVQKAISLSSDPDSDGLFDRCEYFVGVGLAAVQQYIGSTYAQFKISKAAALRIPPEFRPGLTIVAAINAGANYWKHRDEWGLKSVVTRDTNLLSANARQTIRTIEAVTAWSDYTCVNLVAGLLDSSHLSLDGLIPKLTLWRRGIDLLNAELS